METNDQFIESNAKKFEEIFSQLKVCLFDCDGILTDCKIYWIGEEAGWVRSFNVQDGYGLKLLMKMGIKVGVISGGDSAGLKQRIKGLGLDYSFLGNEDKVGAYKEVLKLSGANDSEILYMGDDYFDLPILKTVGFSATVKHAPKKVREACHLVSSREAGQGCVREIVEMIAKAKNFEENFPAIGKEEGEA